MIKSYILFVFFFISAILSAQESINYAVVKDIPYRTTGDPYGLERCKLDVYYPENGKDFGTVVWFHGGGLSGGSKFIPEELKNSGLAAKVADDLEKVIPNHEVRSVNPGHIIRGGDITPYDRILSIRFGVKACELIDEGLFGNVVTLHGETMDYTSLEEVIGDAKFGKQKRVDPNGELIRAAKAIGVCFGDE